MASQASARAASSPAARPETAASGQALQPLESITVNTTDDELNSDGDCSLREAITAANTNAAVDACTAGVPGADTIVFGVTGTITLGSTLPNITDDLMISGPGAANLTISGKNAVHVLFMNAGVTLTVQDLTVASGDADIRSGKLTPAQGQHLIDEANAIIAALSAGGYWLPGALKYVYLPLVSINH